MIKLTFEGKFYLDLIAAIRDFLSESDHPDTATAVPAPPPKVAAGQPKKRPEPKPKPKPKLKPATKPLKIRDKAHYDSLQEVKAEDLEPVPEPAFEDIVMGEPEPEILDPMQLSAIRVRTTEDLQAAYSSGKHKQVLALLARYGNGAKSFRELQIKDFVPIRKAIDEGALT